MLLLLPWERAFMAIPTSCGAAYWIRTHVGIFLIVDSRYHCVLCWTFRLNKISAGHFGSTKSPLDISAKHNRRRSKSAQNKNKTTLLYSTLIRKKFVCEVNSFAFTGSTLHWEHDCIFALSLRLSVNHYYKQVISAQLQ